MSPRLVLLYTCFLSSPIDPIPGKSRLLILLQLNFSRLWAPIKGPTLLWSFSNSTPNISKHHQTVWVMFTLSSLCFLAIKYHKVSNVDSFDMFWYVLMPNSGSWTTLNHLSLGCPKIPVDPYPSSLSARPNLQSRRCQFGATKYPRTLARSNGWSVPRDVLSTSVEVSWTYVELFFDLFISSIF